jgi:hypothetical protein
VSTAQISVDDTLMFVPIHGTLSLIFRWPSSWKEVVNLNQDNGYMAWNYFGGKQYRSLLAKMRARADSESHDYYPIFIQLYYDDFEPANPLGSKSVIHKIGAFYFTVLNFPQKLNSKLDMIHLVTLAYSGY